MIITEYVWWTTPEELREAADLLEKAGKSLQVGDEMPRILLDQDEHVLLYAKLTQ